MHTLCERAVHAHCLRYPTEHGCTVLVVDRYEHCLVARGVKLLLPASIGQTAAQDCEGACNKTISCFGCWAACGFHHGTSMAAQAAALDSGRFEKQALPGHPGKSPHNDTLHVMQRALSLSGSAGLPTQPRTVPGCGRPCNCRMSPTPNAALERAQLHDL